MFHVCPDLVGSPGFQLAFDQGNIVQAFEHLVMGDRPFAFFRVIIDRHYPAIGYTASNIAGYRTILLQITPNQGQVFATDTMIKKLAREVGHRALVFTDKQQARGIFVYPMHQSRTAIITRQRR